jgi:hypothetical protein
MLRNALAKGILPCIETHLLPFKLAYHTLDNSSLYQPATVSVSFLPA